MTEDIILRVDHISKSFQTSEGTQKVIQDISLEVMKKSVLCILGYSGCGKTTLLRIMSALEKPDEGNILVDNSNYCTPSKDVLLLFQDFNQLFPWKSILLNIVHALLITKTALDRKSAVLEAEAVLKEVGLYEYRNRYPRQLSGGMKQRAAVARALALKPKILLMDEPFASLDMVTRHNLQKLVREKCLKYDISVVFVTHGVEEAVLIGDRIVIMKANPGEIGFTLDNTYIATGSSVDKMKMMSIIMEQLNNQTNQEEG
ncbi:MAG: ATP-binding cassette domain-containing protein [Lachnospiraceae bacterium]|nr:ATP-binding cassette domain-containing protein [Lachnospiraceae bacterium]